MWNVGISVCCEGSIYRAAREVLSMFRQGQLLQKRRQAETNLRSLKRYKEKVAANKVTYTKTKVSKAKVAKEASMAERVAQALVSRRPKLPADVHQSILKWQALPKQEKFDGEDEEALSRDDKAEAKANNECECDYEVGPFEYEYEYDYEYDAFAPARRVVTKPRVKVESEDSDDLPFLGEI